VLERDRWYCFECHGPRETTVGRANGELAAWIDGRLYLHFTGIRWRNSADVKLEALTASTSTCTKRRRTTRSGTTTWSFSTVLRSDRRADSPGSTFVERKKGRRSSARRREDEPAPRSGCFWPREAMDIGGAGLARIDSSPPKSTTRASQGDRKRFFSSPSRVALAAARFAARKKVLWRRTFAGYATVCSNGSSQLAIVGGVDTADGRAACTRPRVGRWKLRQAVIEVSSTSGSPTLRLLSSARKKRGAFADPSTSPPGPRRTAKRSISATNFDRARALEHARVGDAETPSPSGGSSSSAHPTRAAATRSARTASRAMLRESFSSPDATRKRHLAVREHLRDVHPPHLRAARPAAAAGSSRASRPCPVPQYSVR
jgi:hypothetical protein